MTHEASTLFGLIQDHMQGAILVVVKNVILVDLLQQIMRRFFSLAFQVLVGSSEE